MTEQLVTTSQLSVFYGNHQALEHVNLCIPKGSRTAIIGPNGAGKSTFIKCLLQLESFTGTMTLFNRHELSALDRSRLIAYIPQHASVNEQFPITVFDIVMMGRYPYITNWLKRPSAVDKMAVMEALEKMSLTDLKDRHITALSGGQKQRVFVARAIAQQAELYILDEPLANVDKISEHIIMSILKEFQQKGKTSIVIHHDLNTVKQYFDYIIWLNRTVIAQGDTDTTFTPQWYQEAFKTAGLPHLETRENHGYFS